jgi:RimJ/RimL family protein N-acetyltransferase
VCVRPIDRGDKKLLARGLAELSPESAYRRFMTSTPKLTDRQLEHLTAVDHDHQEALLAIDPGSGELIGVARYARDDDDPSRAEIALVVADAWQRRGVATLLSERLLERARTAGITTFQATVLTDNVPVLAMLGRDGWQMTERDSGVVELAISLEDLERHDRSIRGALAVAARQLLAIARSPF